MHAHRSMTNVIVVKTTTPIHHGQPCVTISLREEIRRKAEKNVRGDSAQYVNIKKYIHRVKWRHEIYGHDTFAILRV